jgi:hypothetical protein
VPCHSPTPKSSSNASASVYQGTWKPVRRFQRSMSGCGARDTYASVVSRAFRCAGWASWAAIIEQPRQPRSGQPPTPGSKKKR